MSSETIHIQILIHQTDCTIFSTTMLHAMTASDVRIYTQALMSVRELPRKKGAFISVLQKRERN